MTETLSPEYRAELDRRDEGTADRRDLSALQSRVDEARKLLEKGWHVAALEVLRG